MLAAHSFRKGLDIAFPDRVPGGGFHPTLVAAPTQDSRVAATARVAEALGVGVDVLVVATPCDGLCLYHSVHAFMVGRAEWLRGRDAFGFQNVALTDLLH